MVNHVPDRRPKRATKLEIKAKRGGENEPSPPSRGVCELVPSLRTRPISRADGSIVVEDLEKDVVREGVYRRKWEVFGDYFDPQKKMTSDVIRLADVADIGGTYCDFDDSG